MARTLIFSYLLLLSLIATIRGAECHGKPGPIHTNDNPIISTPPKFLRQNEYAKLYLVGQGDTTLKLVHTYGNMYQMGYGVGSILKEQLRQFMDQLWKYIEQQFEQLIPQWMPKRLYLSGMTVGAALDLTYYATKQFTNKAYYQELKGIADGAGIDFKLLRRVHMIGQLTKGTCSMYGAWGLATKNQKTLQLRSLDWDFDGPYWKYPLLTVYHPNSNKLGSEWLNIGFMGWTGVISGINQHRLAVSEIGVYFSDGTWGKESRFGNPFTFVLRDILQYDQHLNQSISRLHRTRRTCDLLLGVGDGKAEAFRGFQYSHSVLNVYSDDNLEPYNSTWHPRLQNIVYWGMDWLCPSYNQRFAEQLQQYYSEIDPENTIRNILPSIDSGNLQAVVYDLTDAQVYISYGAVTSSGKKVNAFDRSFIKLDLHSLFTKVY